MNETCSICHDGTRLVVATLGDKFLCFGCRDAYKIGYIDSMDAAHTPIEDIK